jgi:hypothetical protein
MNPSRYIRNMRNDRQMVLRLAARRQRRLAADGRPRFDLTREHAESSTQTAMRLARASKSQVSERAENTFAGCA